MVVYKSILIQNGEPIKMGLVSVKEFKLMYNTIHGKVNAYYLWIGVELVVIIFYDPCVIITSLIPPTSVINQSCAHILWKFTLSFKGNWLYAIKLTVLNQWHTEIKIISCSNDAYNIRYTIYAYLYGYVYNYDSIGVQNLSILQMQLSPKWLTSHIKGETLKLPIRT